MISCFYETIKACEALPIKYIIMLLGRRLNATKLWEEEKTKALDTQVAEHEIFHFQDRCSL